MSNLCIEKINGIDLYCLNSDEHGLEVIVEDLVKLVPSGQMHIVWNSLAQFDELDARYCTKTETELYAKASNLTTLPVTPSLIPFEYAEKAYQFIQNYRPQPQSKTIIKVRSRRKYSEIYDEPNDSDSEGESINGKNKRIARTDSSDRPSHACKSKEMESNENTPILRPSSPGISEFAIKSTSKLIVESPSLGETTPETIPVIRIDSSPSPQSSTSDDYANTVTLYTAQEDGVLKKTPFKAETRRESSIHEKSDAKSKKQDNDENPRLSQYCVSTQETLENQPVKDILKSISQDIKLLIANQDKLLRLFEKRF